MKLRSRTPTPVRTQDDPLIALPRLLITGASGLVGAACVRMAVASRRWSVIAVSGSRPVAALPGLESQLHDLLPEGAPEALLQRWKPAAILHAAALSEPGEVDRHPERAEHLNVSVPAALAREAVHLGAALLHCSTDMVFDGLEAPYGPESPRRPHNPYSRQKAASEEAVLGTHSGACVLRLPLVHGNSPSGRRSLHEKLLLALSEGKRPRLFQDEWRTPASAESIATVALGLLERRMAGTYHWAGADRLSRLEIGLAVLQRFNLPDSLIGSMSLHEFEGKRPPDLSMRVGGLDQALEIARPSHAQQLATLREPPGLVEKLARLRAATSQVARTGDRSASGDTSSSAPDDEPKAR